MLSSASPNFSFFFRLQQQTYIYNFEVVSPVLVWEHFIRFKFQLPSVYLNKISLSIALLTALYL